MKPKFNPFLVVSFASFITFTAHAADVTKADNIDVLNLGTSWGGTAPGASDVATWAGVYNTAGSLSAGFTASTPVSWQGIKIGALSGTAAGLVSIGGTGAAVTGSQITIGTSGIDMSAANQNLVINSATTVISGNQIWNVATGRNLRFGTTGTTSANANLDGSGTITIQGGGVVDMNQGGSAGFSDAAGFAGFSGKWIVGSGATLRGIRNGATAWGTNTAADTITLQGGTLAFGGISGSQGDWTWNSNITLAASTSSTVDNQHFTGNNRRLKLMGAFTGSGNLTFANTGPVNNSDNGFILTATNTNSGTVTVNSGAFVRVGGNSGATDVTYTSGATGTLGDGSVTNNVVNNGTLSITRTNAITIAQAISGTGVLNIGTGGTQGGANSNAQVVTLSGTNTYTGVTTINNGTLALSGGAAIADTGAVILADASGATLRLDGSETIGSLRGGGVSGGAVNLQGNTLTVGETGTQSFAGAISGTGGGLTKTGAGTLTLSGANGYTGSTTITGGTLSLTGSGSISNTSAVNVNNGTLSTYSVNAIGASASTINLGSAATQGILTYTGAGETSNRVLNFAGTTGGATINASGSGLLQLTAATTTTSSGAKGITFGGTGAGRLDGAIVNNGGILNMIKADAGTWTLNGSIATGGGAITTSGGTLTLGGTTNTTAGTVTVGSGGTLTVANGGTLTTTGTLQLGASTTTNAFNVNSGGIANADILNNSWGTDVTVNGTLNVTTSYTVSTNATKFIAGSGTINAASFTTGNSNTVVNFTNTGSMNLTGATTIGASTTINQSAGTIGTSGLVVSGAANSYVMTGGRINLGAGGITGTQSASLGAGTVGARADWSSARNMSLTNTATGTTFNTLDSVDGTTARTITLSGVLSGTGKLVKADAGTLTLSNAGNSFSGDVAINGGTLIATGASANTNTALGAASGSRTVAVNSGGTLSFTSANVFGGSTQMLANTIKVAVTGGTMTTSNYNVVGNIDLNGGLLTATGGSGSTYQTYEFNGSTITVGGSSASTISSTAGSNGGMHIAGGKTLTLAVADATGNANSDLTISASLLNGSDDRTGAGALLKTGAGTLTLSGANTYSGLTTVDGGKLTISNTLLNSSGITVNTGATAELGATNMFTSGHGAAVDNARVLTINNGTLLMNSSMDSRIGNVTLNNGSTWTSNRGLTNYDILLANTSTGAATVAVTGTGASTMNGTGGIHLQGVQNFAVADVTGSAAADLTVSMVLGSQGSAAGDAGGINKTGAGTMQLTANNTFTGNITINGGVLDISSGGLYRDAAGAAAFTNAATVTINAGGTLKLKTYSYNGDGGTGGLADYGDRRVLNGGTLEVAGATHASGNNFTVTATGGTFRYNPAVTSDTLTLVGNGNSDITLAGTLTAQTDGNMVISETITGVGGIDKTGAETLTLSGTNNYVGATTISAGTLQIGAGGTTGSLSPSSAITNNATLAFNRSNTITQGTDFAAVISGSGAVTQAGTGTLVLSGTNTYTGGTTLSGGILALGSAGALGSSGNIVFGGGTLQYSANNTADYSARIAAGTSTGSVSIDTNGQDVAFGTGLTASQSGGLTKIGAGTLTLGVANTYTGATNVNGGKLVVNGSLASTTTTVASGATLGGTGTLAGTTTIQANGIHGPGNSPGVQTFTNLTYNDESIFSWDLATLTESGRGTQFDGVDVTGNLSVDPGAIFRVVLGTAGSENDGFWASDRTWSGVFGVTGAITGIFTHFSVVDSGFNPVTIANQPNGYFTFDNSNGSLGWSAVPEPTSALAGLLLGAGLLRRRKR